MKEYKIPNHESSYLPEGCDWELVWSDEFDGTELDESKWMYRLNFWGKPFPAYCNKGVSLDGKGNVVFTPVKMEDGRICSAQLQTGSNTFDIPKPNYDNDVNGCGDNHFWPFGTLPKPTFMHRYGYYEVRCRFQQTDGWWSAFWLQASAIGTTYDPAWSGVEVDIVEYFGHDELTSGNFYGGYGKDLKNDARVNYEFKDGKDEFHRFGLLWTENEYVFYFDGKETARTSGPISQIPQFILLTTEVQGYRRGNGAKHDEKSEESIGDTFVVDYVRVFDIVEDK